MHHIDGNGQDAGVVYCEMQSYENTPRDLMSNKFVLTEIYLYPCLTTPIYRMKRLVDAPGSGYRSETGGLMAALRILTPERSGLSLPYFVFTEFSLVRKYHANCYAPHNMAVIVTGKLTEGTQSLLRVVQEQVEPSLIQHNQNKGSRPAGWKRPFVETASAQRKPIPATKKAVVEFPEKDESMAYTLFSR